MTCDLTIPSKETLGQVSAQLSQRELETKDPLEQMRENLTEYDRNIWECVDRGKKEFICDFFVEVTTKKEPLMPNVLRNYFSCRQSCPTPNYDQTVYKFTLKNDRIEFLWVIPDRQTCYIFLENKLEIVPEEYGLLDFVLKFAKGDLFKLCKQLNGEDA